MARNSLTNFGEQDAEFLSTLESIKAEQELLLISGGLGGDFNATIAKLMLTNHGYSDKAQVDNTSSDGSMSPNLKIEFINASNTFLSRLCGGECTDTTKFYMAVGINPGSAWIPTDGTPIIIPI